LVVAGGADTSLRTPSNSLAGAERDLECPHGQNGNRGQQIAAQHHKALTEILFAAAAGAVLVSGGPLLLRSRRRRIAAGGSADRLTDVRHLDRNTWRMPPLDTLSKPVMSPVRKAGLLLLRGYLIASVLLITIKIFSAFFH
jgi:hypothetical protein